MLVERFRLVWPGILWNDIRSEAQVKRLAQQAVAPIQPSAVVIGGLTAAAASDLGLRPRLPVVIGMLDSAAELIGVGVTGSSVVVMRLGTAGGVMILAGRPEHRSGCTLCPHPIRPLCRPVRVAEY